MGVEPTAACSAQPATDFEDRGAHRDATTPTISVSKLVSATSAAAKQDLTVCLPLDRILGVLG